MSSLVGHGLAALAGYQLLKRPCRLPGGAGGAALALALGILPDLDVAAGILLGGQVAHRGLSHSLVFAAGAALIAALACNLRRPANLPRAWIGLLLVAAVHPFLDYLMACGPPVPLFWPWIKKGYLSPVQVVPTAYYSRSWQGLLALLHHGPTIRGMLLEVLIFLPLIPAACLVPRLRSRPLLWLALLPLLALSLAGLWLTRQIYA